MTEQFLTIRRRIPVHDCQIPDERRRTLRCIGNRLEDLHYQRERTLDLDCTKKLCFVYHNQLNWRNKIGEIDEGKLH